MRKILLFTLVVLSLSSCWRSWYRPVLSDTFYAIRNETPYHIILSLEVFDTFNSRYVSLELETNKQNKFAVVNMNDTFKGGGNWREDSIMLFNLNDTTSIVWSAIPPPSGGVFDSFFRSLFQEKMPQWITAPEDVLKWEVSRRAWNIYLVNDWHEKMLLTVTGELLGIMQKDYSMLERFSEFYE